MKMVKQIRTKNKIISQTGFSLIELLVVISIIGLIASVVLTSLIKARTTSRHVAILKSLTSVNQALRLYQQDNGDYPPGLNQAAIYNTKSSIDQLMTDLKPYLNGNLYDLPFQSVSSNLIQGYDYVKGTEQSPQHIQYYNGLTSQYIGCVTIYDGYALEAVLNHEQDQYTLKDGGYDPDGLDFYGGHFVFGPNCL